MIVAQLMNYVVVSAVESEMTVLFLTATEMISFSRRILHKMGWKQPPSQLQPDILPVVGMTNPAVIP